MGEPSLWDVPAAVRRETKQRAEGVAAEHRARVLAAFRRLGRMTADHAGQAVGLGPLQVRPRVTELKQAGLIRPAGRGVNLSGNPATLFEAVP